jgi:hypothetical protein
LAAFMSLRRRARGAAARGARGRIKKEAVPVKTGTAPSRYVSVVIFGAGTAYAAKKNTPFAVLRLPVRLL